MSRHEEPGLKLLVNAIFKREAALWLSVLVSVVGVTVYAQSKAAERIDEHVDAGIAPTVRHVDELQTRFERHEAESEAVHREMREQLTEVQGDIRALYKAVMTGHPQERLEQPRDGGK